MYVFLSLKGHTIYRRDYNSDLHMGLLPWESYRTMLAGAQPSFGFVGHSSGHYCHKFS